LSRTHFGGFSEQNLKQAIIASFLGAIYIASLAADEDSGSGRDGNVMVRVSVVKFTQPSRFMTKEQASGTCQQAVSSPSLSFSL
jgi:hypothetical protein